MYIIFKVVVNQVDMDVDNMDTQPLVCGHRFLSFKVNLTLVT